MRSENNKAYISYVLAALTALAAWYLLPMLFAGKELTLTAFFANFFVSTNVVSTEKKNQHNKYNKEHCYNFQY